MWRAFEAIPHPMLLAVNVRLCGPVQRALDLACLFGGGICRRRANDLTYYVNVSVKDALLHRPHVSVKKVHPVRLVADLIRVNVNGGHVLVATLNSFVLEAHVRSRSKYSSIIISTDNLRNDRAKGEFGAA
jgi:hypothetical protein